MGICWYCHWGWPRVVREIHDAAVAKMSDTTRLYFGPAHIVWEDENFEARHIQWCIEEMRLGHNCDGISPDDLLVIQQSLEELLAVPETVRCCQPSEYDDVHPELFPPPAGLECAKPIRDR